MDDFSFAAFRAALTWHTAIEVIAIIIAACIVHPLTSAVKRLFGWFAQRIAASSQRRAISRIKFLCVYYAHIWDMKQDFDRHPAHAALVTSSSNLRLILLAIFSCYVGDATGILSFPVGFVMLIYVYVQYNKTISERRDVMSFDTLRSTIRLELLELKPIADNDGWLAEMWRARFDEEPPFIVQNDGRTPFSPPRLKS